MKKLNQKDPAKEPKKTEDSAEPTAQRGMAVPAMRPTGETLTAGEAKALAACEKIIETAADSLGKALAEIRDSRLYRAEYSSFEAYCQGRWGRGRRWASREISVCSLSAIYPDADPADVRRVAMGNADLASLGSNTSQTRVCSLNNEGLILNSDEVDGDIADDVTHIKKERVADARRRRDIEALAAHDLLALSPQMQESIKYAALRLCKLTEKVSTKVAQQNLGEYVPRITELLTEIAPTFVEAMEKDGMKPGKAVCGIMGALNRSFPRQPVNHTANVESGLKKLRTSLHLYGDFEDLRKQTMESWLVKLAPAFPAAWRKILISRWEGERNG